jgi:hypothetical protein
MICRDAHRQIGAAPLLDDEKGAFSLFADCCGAYEVVDLGIVSDSKLHEFSCHHE